MLAALLDPRHHKIEAARSTSDADVRSPRTPRGSTRLWLWALLLGLVATVLSVHHDAAAAPLRVRVRGTARLVARASRDQTNASAAQAAQPNGAAEMVLSGSLADDAGDPMALQSITVRVRREAAPDDSAVAEGLRAARGCDSAADPALPAPSGAPGQKAWAVRVTGTPEAPEVVVTTDEDGRFCFRARVPPDRYAATLVYRSSPPSLVDGTEREISFDLTKRGLALRFDPTPRVVQLDAPETTVDAVAIVDDDANPRVAPGLSIRLANEQEEIGRAETDAAGRARFHLPGAKLGPPGPGELHVSFDGDADTSRAAHSEQIERHVKVMTKVPAAERGELAAGVPEEGIPLVAEVSSTLGPVAEGSVEARVADVVVGTAPVERGIARLTLTFTGQGSEAFVRLRYVPTSPWYEPLGEPTIRVPIRGPSLVSKAPILLAGLAVLAFFLFGRVSAQRSKPEPEPAKVDPPAREAKARMEVVRLAARGEEGWSGTVVDAHDGFPIRGARVWIERGTFEGRAILASVETDADGRFSLPGVGPAAGDELISAEGRLHARLTQDLPAPGEVSIALAERRRALLAKLVAWARRRGAPFDARPEPTPGHVRRAASGELATARWADAIERAAFGPGEVDARAELEIERLAPDARDGHRRGGAHARDDDPPR